MKPIQFLTHQEIESHYAKASKQIPLPEITDDHRQHIVSMMLKENASRYAKNIVGRLNGQEGWSRLNLDKDAKERIQAWRESEKWKNWLNSIGASFCERRQKWITTNL